MSKLDKEEKEILESYERGQWKPVAEPEAESQRYQAIAKATYKKDEHLSIRLSRKVQEKPFLVPAQDGVFAD